MHIDHTHNIIELHDVSFSYHAEETTLSHITFNIHKGDYLGIIGPNGGGKTTLLKLMLGLLKPDSGIIKLFGQDIRDFKDWYKIGYVRQKAVNFEQNFPITVKEVASMGLYGKKGLLNNLNQADWKRVEKALRQVDMWEYKERIISNLSGGQQQRVYIARALASSPEIIFLDEPTSGVDQQTQKKFYALLKELNERLHLTLVIVSHDTNIIAQQVTEIACVNTTLVYETDPKAFINTTFHSH